MRVPRKEALLMMPKGTLVRRLSKTARVRSVRVHSSIRSRVQKTKNP